MLCGSAHFCRIQQGREGNLGYGRAQRTHYYLFGHFLKIPYSSLQDQLHNLHGPVQNENAGLLVKKITSNFNIPATEWDPLSMGLCVTVPIVHPWIADRDFRKLLCDPQFKKFCPRFSGCDIDMNKEVITGLKCGVWFCSLCEYHMQDFLNGISPTLTYVMYLPITICK